MLTKVRSVGIYVSDQDRALRFYTEVLGCTLIADNPMGPGPDAERWIEVRLPHDAVNLLLYTPPSQSDRIGTFTNLILHCDDIEKTFQELSAKGVMFTAKPKLESWGRWWAQFVDLDGNEFGLGMESDG